MGYIFVLLALIAFAAVLWILGRALGAVGSFGAWLVQIGKLFVRKTDKALTLDDFRKLKRGTILRLHYDHVNRGEFLWSHDRVEGNRVLGKFAYLGDEWSEVGDYLYEFHGEVCRGSDAEPVWDRVPPLSTRGSG